jgi:hypothetical protein
MEALFLDGYKDYLEGLPIPHDSEAREGWLQAQDDYIMDQKELADF